MSKWRAVAQTSDDEINQYQEAQQQDDALFAEPDEPLHPIHRLAITEQQWRDLCDRAWERSDGTARVL